MRGNGRIAAILGLVLCGAFLLGTSYSEPTPSDEKTSESARIEIPEPLRIEHEHLHEQLRQAMQAGGKTGEAAQAVADVMAPHFEEENRIALPPLSLLSPLSKGEVTPEMEEVLPLTEKLRDKLPQMLQEHERIKAALEKLAQAAERENKPEQVEFAHRLILHARTEEEVLYPAALLVGERVRMKLRDRK